MIPSSELRIGNWVIDSKRNRYQLKTGADIDNASQYAPIELNNDTMLQCGFEFDNYFHLWQKKTTGTNAIEMELDSSFNVRDFGHRYMGVIVSNVHQLQNLFYALKQRDLDTSDLIKNLHKK